MGKKKSEGGSIHESFAAARFDQAVGEGTSRDPRGEAVAIPVGYRRSSQRCRAAVLVLGLGQAWQMSRHEDSLHEVERGRACREGEGGQQGDDRVRRSIAS